MMSKQMRKQYDKAKEIDEGLTAYDFEFTKMVEVRHQDGTFYQFRWAFVRQLEDGFFAVFSEHNGFHVFHKEDVEYSEWEMKKMNGNPLIDHSGEEDGEVLPS